jgi:hypothetical protein
MRISRITFASVLGVVLSFSAAVTAKADAIYTYTGNDFTIIDGPYATSDYISASFTFADPLSFGFLNFVSPTSWSITDQTTTLTSASDNLSLELETDAAGDVIACN